MKLTKAVLSGKYNETTYDLQIKAAETLTCCYAGRQFANSKVIEELIKIGLVMVYCEKHEAQTGSAIQNVPNVYRYIKENDSSIADICEYKEGYIDICYASNSEVRFEQIKRIIKDNPRTYFPPEPTPKVPFINTIGEPHMIKITKNGILTITNDVIKYVEDKNDDDGYGQEYYDDVEYS